MPRLLVALILLLALSNNAFGESVAPPPVNDVITVPATTKRDPVQRIRLGGFEAEFEKTTLGEIRDALGCGSIVEISEIWDGKESFPVMPQSE